MSASIMRRIIGSERSERYSQHASTRAASPAANALSRRALLGKGAAADRASHCVQRPHGDTQRRAMSASVSLMDNGATSARSRAAKLTASPASAEARAAASSPTAIAASAEPVADRKSCTRFPTTCAAAVGVSMSSTSQVPVDPTPSRRAAKTAPQYGRVLNGVARSSAGSAKTTMMATRRQKLFTSTLLCFVRLTCKLT